ncbi:MAG TPA: hypothetical protein DCL38_03360 [Lachnospiraceae bacterium]|nr:hypothetical protein [Lachnospiraceae bacterium]
MPEWLDNAITIIEFIGLILLGMLPAVLVVAIPIWLIGRRDAKKKAEADVDISGNEQKKDEITAFFETVVPFLGPAMVMGGIIIAVVMGGRTDQKLRRTTAETTGYVTSSYYEYDSDGDSSYSITVEFEADGTVYSRTRDLSSDKKKGTPYIVRYNPDDPSEFYIEDFDRSSGQIRMLGILISAAGVPLTIVGLSRWVRGKRKEKTFGEGFE